LRNRKASDTMPNVGTDVVVVAYRSATELRTCVAPLCDEPSIRVVVVDNACPERSVETIRDLPVQIVEMGRNVGFAAGCNAGAAVGSSDAILFLNPDAEIAPHHVNLLARTLDGDPTCGAVGPRIIFRGSGLTQKSIRRRPSLASAFAEALFLHHVFRNSRWATEDVLHAYDEPLEDAPWLIGAALCVRRDAFRQVGGWDERFFMYGEDADLGLRLREHGWTLRYEPAAFVLHTGRGSGETSAQSVMRAESRLRFARTHERGLRYFGFRTAFALYELVRIPLAATRSQALTRARVKALAVTLALSRHGGQ
jgi:N-acetylglucosaminyl-diphospho-decaprenol L-rhamnosyltransferase